MNNKLHSGPDSINQLAEVLIRFCTEELIMFCSEEVVFMGDIGTMYYQLQIPFKDTVFLNGIFFLRTSWLSVGKKVLSFENL